MRYGMSFAGNKENSMNVFDRWRLIRKTSGVVAEAGGGQFPPLIPSP